MFKHVLCEIRILMKMGWQGIKVGFHLYDLVCMNTSRESTIPHTGLSVETLKFNFGLTIGSVTELVNA